ncbi:MAG: hypothetical protein U1F43_22495 [Myxococcota bacterium]
MRTPVTPVMPRTIVLALALLAAPACGDSGSKAASDTAVASDSVADTSVGADSAASDTSVADTLVADTLVADATPDATDGADTVAPDTVGSCDRSGFVAVAQDAGHAFGAFNYLAQTSLGEPVDVLSFQLADDGGAAAAGRYELTGENFATCANCVIAYIGCDADLAGCAKTFLAQSGTLDISAFGASGGHFTGTLDQVVLAEVTLDDDFNSTLVEGGETWCLDGYAFDAVVQ